MHYLRIDIGSSPVKVPLVDSTTGISKCVVKEPEKELSISTPEKGRAEQISGKQELFENTLNQFN